MDSCVAAALVIVCIYGFWGWCVYVVEFCEALRADRAARSAALRPRTDPADRARAVVHRMPALRQDQRGLADRRLTWLE